MTIFSDSTEFFHNLLIACNNAPLRRAVIKRNVPELMFEEASTKYNSVVGHVDVWVK